MPMKLTAFIGLLRKYRDVFAASWAIRERLSSKPREPNELQFLPASLEIAETPVHPAPRWAMRIIVLLTLAIIAMGVLGQLDIVVTAKGKLVPNARVKVIQPAITGVVQHINVEDGQRVSAGQILLELDPTQARADVKKSHTQHLEAALAMARARALLEAQAGSKLPTLPSIGGVDDADFNQTMHFTQGIYLEYQDKIARASAEKAQREQDLASTLHDIDRLRSTAPLAREQANNYRSLSKDKYVSRNDYLDKEQAALGQEHDLAAKISHAGELRAAIMEQTAELASVSSAFRREQLDAYDKADQQFRESAEDEIKAQTREKLMVLASPVAGTVQQMGIHTIGGVVTSAQSVMEIVPDDSLEVEVGIQNKDVGFVKEGQPVVIKIEAFPYTYYGYINGTVISVANDASQNKSHELTFTSRIRLDSNRIHAGGRWINLMPGMAVSAEIKTGRRSVGAYFFDPLLRVGQESMRER